VTVADPAADDPADVPLVQSLVAARGLLHRVREVDEAAQALVDEIRAAAPVWPPPVTHPNGVVRPLRGRPPVVLAGLTPPPGCARNADDMPCAIAPGGRWACNRCGVVTRVFEPFPGPRLPECACRDAVCLHPGPVPRRERP
jgi:hypothetical protein